MPRIIFVNHTCPICKDHVDYDPDYDPKTAAGHGNVEWVLTKRGLKQYFHTQCYYAMIEAQKIEKCLSKKGVSKCLKNSLLCLLLFSVIC